MENPVNVRVLIAREVWAEVKAKAVREDKKLGPMLEDILREHFTLEMK